MQWQLSHTDCLCAGDGALTQITVRIVAFSRASADYEFVIAAFVAHGFRFSEFVSWTAQCRPPMNPNPGSTETLSKQPNIPKDTIMTRFTQIAALALSFAAAGTAFAESPDVLAPQPALSIATRAEVQAVTLAALANGHHVVGEADLYKADAASVRSRADVRAETLAAIASGEVHALSTESNTFGAPFTPAKRASVTTQMALAGK
jgi:hypothetical protein